MCPAVLRESVAQEIRGTVRKLSHSSAAYLQGVCRGKACVCARYRLLARFQLLLESKDARILRVCIEREETHWLRGATMRGGAVAAERWAAAARLES